MTNNETAGFSKPYLIIVLLLMLVLPILSVVFDYVFHRQTFILIPDITQWFIFWPVGIRLFTAGCKQVLQPAFTAREIFHLKEKNIHDDDDVLLEREITPCKQFQISVKAAGVILVSMTRPKKSLQINT